MWAPSCRWGRLGFWGWVEGRTAVPPHPEKEVPGGTGDLQEVFPRLTWEGAGLWLGSGGGKGWPGQHRTPVVLFFREPCGPFFHFLWKDTEAAPNSDLGSLSGKAVTVCLSFLVTRVSIRSGVSSFPFLRHESPGLQTPFVPTLLRLSRSCRPSCLSSSCVCSDPS